ncbi:MAG TPA: hypothetical protein VGJ79_12710 [Candidatus Dormibacteraeota bacterium]
MAVDRPRRKRIEVLKEKLAGSSGTFADLQSIASSLNLMEDRYMARPAAELLVSTGDAEAAQIGQGLAATPVLGRDPSGDLLRAAFKAAMAKEGIPRNVDEMARRFYGRRGHRQGRPPAAASPKASSGSDAPSDPTAGGGILGSIRRIFGNN